MIYSSKYEAILKIMLLYLIEECSLDFFYQGQLDHLVFWWGKGCFFQYMKIDFLRQSESIYFCNHRKVFFIIAIRPLRKLTSVSTSKNISD